MHRIVIFLFCLFLSAHAFAEEDASGMVTLPAGVVHHGNFFAMGNNVEISGIVEGDVYALASQVTIDGQVKGDLLICAMSAEISGKIDHNIRILAGQVIVSGSGGNNITAVGGNVHLAQSAQIKGNVVCVAGNAELAANIQKEATVIASYLRLTGSIGDRLLAYVGKMRLTSRASIAGNLEYRSTNPAIIDPGAHIKGEVIHHPSLVHRLFKGSWIQRLLAGSKVAATLMNFLYSFVIGWILIRLFPKKVELALEALSKEPLKVLGVGLTLVILLPLASLVLLMTILGAPFALTLIALNVIGFYTAKIFSILWVTEEIIRRRKWQVEQRLVALAMGLMVYFILLLIPYFGFALTWAALVFGLGAVAEGNLMKSKA
jgi:hypothetical protein